MGPGFDALGPRARHVPRRDARRRATASLTDIPSLVAFNVGGRRGSDLGALADPDGTRTRLLGSGAGCGCARRARAAATSADVSSLAEETLAQSAVLEGHEDNVAASLYGGVVAVVGRARGARAARHRARRSSCGCRPRARRPRSRAASCPRRCALADATFNVGRTALLVAAIAAGDVGRVALGDRRPAASGHPPRGRAREPPSDGSRRRRRRLVLVALGIGPDDRRDGIAGRCSAGRGCTALDGSGTRARTSTTKAR